MKKYIEEKEEVKRLKQELEDLNKQLEEKKRNFEEKKEAVKDGGGSLNFINDVDNQQEEQVEAKEV